MVSAGELDGLGGLALALAQRQERHVHVKQQAALFVAAHHALHPQKAGQALATGDRRDLVQAGAGVVADSRPEAEYQETLNKARGMLKALACLLPAQP